MAHQGRELNGLRHLNFAPGSNLGIQSDGRCASRRARFGDPAVVTAVADFTRDDDWRALHAEAFPVGRVYGTRVWSVRISRRR
jgi:hypothetical protein